MKTIKSITFAIALALMSFAAVPPTTVSKIKKEIKKAVLSWKSEEIDLGEIPVGKPKAITFEFKNTGTAEVVITNVKASCGCTATKYTKAAIQPGKTATITATYNAAAKGTFKKTITVSTSAETAPKTLSFKGTVN